MLFVDEVKAAPKELAHPEVSGAELTMAKTLVGAMVRDFQPQAYKNEYQARLWEIINQKIQGEEITVPQESGTTTVIDIMEALKQSLANVGSAS